MSEETKVTRYAVMDADDCLKSVINNKTHAQVDGYLYVDQEKALEAAEVCPHDYNAWQGARRPTLVKVEITVIGEVEHTYKLKDYVPPKPRKSRAKKTKATKK